MEPYLLAALTGVAFSLVGLGYAIGGRRGVSPFYIGAFMYLGQVLYFLPRLETVPWPAAQPVVLAAVGSSLVSFAGFFIMRKGMAMGLLSSIWIALNLTFVPQTLFCVLVYDEPVTPAQWTGMALGILCIIILSGQNKSPASGPASAAPGGSIRRALGIGVLLMGQLLCNSAWLLMMKILSYMPYPGSAHLFEKGQSLYIVLQAIILFVLTAAMAAKHEPGAARFKAALPGGLVIAVGSVAGLVLISLCVVRQYSAALCFPIYSVISIVLMSLFSVTLFGERPDRFWVAGNVVAVLCVLALLF